MSVKGLVNRWFRRWKYRHITTCATLLGDFDTWLCDRKYKDYVYRKMLVQEYLKKWRIFKRVKPKNDMMFHDIYNCICQNTKKIRFIIHYVKPTAQLLFRIRFPKGGPTCRRQVVNPRHQTSQGQWLLDWLLDQVTAFWKYINIRAIKDWPFVRGNHW